MFLYRTSGEMGMMGCRKMALSHIPTISSHRGSGHGSFGADQHARPPLGAKDLPGKCLWPMADSWDHRKKWGDFPAFLEKIDKHRTNVWFYDIFDASVLWLQPCFTAPFRAPRFTQPCFFFQLHGTEHHGSMWQKVSRKPPPGLFSVTFSTAQRRVWPGTRFTNYGIATNHWSWWFLVHHIDLGKL